MSAGFGHKKKKNKKKIKKKKKEKKIKIWRVPKGKFITMGPDSNSFV